MIPEARSVASLDPGLEDVLREIERHVTSWATYEHQFPLRHILQESGLLEQLATGRFEPRQRYAIHLPPNT